MPRTLQEWTQIQAEEGLARMLETLSEASGIPLADIMASEFEEPEEGEPEFRETELEEERAQEREPEIDQDFGPDIDDYFDELFDDIGVDADEDDAYTDAEV